MDLWIHSVCRQFDFKLTFHGNSDPFRMVLLAGYQRRLIGEYGVHVPDARMCNMKLWY